MTGLTIPHFSQRLQHLALNECHDGTLVRAIPDTSSMYSLVISNISNLISFTRWPNLPDEGLPTELKCLIIVSCTSLKSLGTKRTLKSLNSLKDLHIEDCPLLLSFPEDGLPTSLQHLLIQDCPSLSEQCGTENVQDPEWTKISHIPDREIDFIRSQHTSKKNAHSAAWYLP
ncbi:hypothetical protein Dsin_021692 [Dipteronia sinensis]|uniref:Uncharacterized protein n=1 Tax=Dipteronia sinensis TaxID=43782 RepID=A0AAE0A156_9ROSI|nr:hypothetical protein Dsin_021692 [Dipteronia sinensis]